jgi:hypothetical protein
MFRFFHNLGAKGDYFATETKKKSLLRQQGFEGVGKEAIGRGIE